MPGTLADGWHDGHIPAGRPSHGDGYCLPNIHGDGYPFAHLDLFAHGDADRASHRDVDGNANRYPDAHADGYGGTQQHADAHGNAHRFGDLDPNPDPGAPGYRNTGRCAPTGEPCRRSRADHDGGAPGVGQLFRLV